ncbi:hypothetical protein BKG68_21375 [Mycobacteroides saopaulense]|uniref:Uncharacterized protein n=1 Tax=Mycobacteroides saopaulense TaxID=1578165 RepID=A0ABX3BZ57_9MYCO|nr:hypothetical protein BKG68_21375 [Mycobacteroides saopaulense]OHU09032.1 hypothetical protein BKG73_13335 [Mycobacteroides saopaulense]
MDALTAEDFRRFPRDKQLAFGRGLRDRMPRRRLGKLSEESRRDPIAVLAAQNASTGLFHLRGWEMVRSLPSGHVGCAMTCPILIQRP